MRGGDGEQAASPLARVQRKLRLFTWAMIAATTVAVVGGSALVAWLLRPTGLPFMETWLVCGVLILGIPIIGRALRRGDGSGPQ